MCLADSFLLLPRHIVAQPRWTLSGAVAEGACTIEKKQNRARNKAWIHSADLQIIKPGSSGAFGSQPS